MKPTVILPDAAPIIHLAAADSLGVLNGLGRVVVVDVVALETTYFPDKPFAHAIAAANRRERSYRQPDIRIDDHRAYAAMSDPISSVIRDYSAGRLTANQAADRLGIGATVNDVIFLLRQAGLPPPSPPPEQEAAELARALVGLGLARRSVQKP